MQVTDSLHEQPSVELECKRVLGINANNWLAAANKPGTGK
jgi:hypothetical protein